MMEDIDNATSDKMGNIETDEEKKNVGCCNKRKVSEKNNMVDCLHLNLDEDLEEKCVDEEFEVKDINHMRYEGLLPLTLVWPDNVELYQPVESGQILFSEMPNCLYVQAFLRMCNLPYTLIQKENTESIGPSGEVPVLRCGSFIVSGAEKIIKFVEAKGILLTSCLTESEKSEMSFYTSLVQMTLANAEDFITWLEPETYRKVTYNRFCSVHPWPLGFFLIKQKQQKVQNKLDAMGWGCKSFGDVCDEINICFKALSDKMEGNYVFGTQPTQLDALVFAHAYTIMTNPLPKSQFAGIILGYPKLVKHCYRVMDSYFNELNTSNQFAELVNNLST